MPMRSQAQRAYLHIHHPEIADRWEDETPKGKKLPEHVKKAEPGPPPGWSLKEWDKHLQRGYKGSKLPKHLKTAYHSLGQQSALEALGIMTGETK